jgi:hypothetical protein
MTHLRELTGSIDYYSTVFHEAERMGLLMEEHKIKFPEKSDQNEGNTGSADRDKMGDGRGFRFKRLTFIFRLVKSL